MKTFNKKSLLIFAVLIVICFCYMVFANFFTPYMADDFTYTLAENSTPVITAFNSQVNHYFVWGGRVVAHFIAQIFLQFDKSIFNIANSAAFLIVTLLVYKISNGDSKKYNFFLYAFIIMAIFLLAPDFGQSNLWLIGSCNYLWGVLFNLLVIYFYVNYAYKKESCKTFSVRNIIICIPFAVLTFIAGAYNENFSPAVLFAVTLLVLKKAKQKQAVPFWAYVGLITMLAGCVFLIAAPGNYARLDIITNENASFLITILSRLAITTYRYLFVMPIFCVSALLIAHKLKNKMYDEAFLPLVFAVSSLLSNFAMVAVNAYPPRASTGVFFLALLSLSIQLPQINYSKYKIQAVIIAVFLSCMFCANIVFASFDIIAANKMTVQRENYIIEQVNAGETEISTYSIVPMTPYCALYGLSELGMLNDDDKWINEIYIDKYGLNSIEATSIAYENWGTVMSIVLQ